MDVTSSQLAETQRAFDSVAATYDAANADNPVITQMRRQLWRAVEHHLPRGARLLDLGCGPGADAVHFAERGYRVVAIDWSPAMVREARRRVARAGAGASVEVRHWGIHDLATLPDMNFDAVYSDLGPLNCVPSLGDAARALTARLRQGGLLIASVIGRLCPWEWVVYAKPSGWSRAGVRFRRHVVPVPLNAHTVWTQYYVPAEFARPFLACGMRQVSVRAMGALVPPPYLEGFAVRHPRLLTVLGGIERVVGGWPGVRQLGDHFLIVLRKAAP